MTVRAGVVDFEFSKEFAELLGGVLTALKIGDIEVHEQFVVIQADADRIIHIDVQAVILQGVKEAPVERPTLRRPQKRRKLRLVSA